MSARDWITERAKLLANERIARDTLIGLSRDEVVAQAMATAPPGVYVEPKGLTVTRWPVKQVKRDDLTLTAG